MDAFNVFLLAGRVQFLVPHLLVPAFMISYTNPLMPRRPDDFFSFLGLPEPLLPSSFALSRLSLRSRPWKPPAKSRQSCGPVADSPAEFDLLPKSL